MGCGASKTAEGRGKDRGEQSRDKAPPRGRGKNSGPPARTREDSQNDKYRQDEENKEADDRGGTGKEEGTVLTANMISDLRSKASKEGGSSVMRWIDCIVEPQESDNVDMFDPMRRHVLSMDSVNSKMNGTSAVQPTKEQNHL